MRGVPVSATRFIGWWGPQKTMKKIASLHSCVHGGQINSPLKSKIDKKNAGVPSSLGPRVLCKKTGFLHPEHGKFPAE